MGETQEHKDSGKQKKNWREYVTVDVLTLVVLAITMCGVFCYACEARKQSGLIAQSLDQEILNGGPEVYQNGVEWSERTPDGVPSKVKIRLKNFGKLLATSVVSVGHILVRPSGEPMPVDPDCDETRKLPTVATVDAIAPNEVVEKYWVPAQGEDLSEALRGKTLYVVGCVYYFGLNRKKRYFSDLCVVWAPNAPQDFQACDDPDRNYAH